MTVAGDSWVFVHSSDELYGADRMLLELLDALPASVRAEVWLPTDLDHPDDPLCVELLARSVGVRHLGLPILRRAYLTPRGLATLGRRFLRLRSALRECRPDVVYCTTSAALLAAPASRLSGRARVIGHLQEIWGRSDRTGLGWAAACCDDLLAISGAVADALPARLARRVTVVPNATAEPDPACGVDGRVGPLTFLVASRWNGWKGHRTLLAAWDRAEPAGELIVLGGPPRSGDVVDVEGMVSRLRRPGSVRVVGEVNDPSPYLDQADVIVVPSDAPEPFGLVAIEAFARGRPVVASSAGGLGEVVRDGIDGWHFPPGDVPALAALLGRLERPDVTTAGRSARARYLEHYTRTAYRDRWRTAVGLSDR